MFSLSLHFLFIFSFFFFAKHLNTCDICSSFIFPMLNAQCSYSCVCVSCVRRFCFVFVFFAFKVVFMPSDRFHLFRIFLFLSLLYSCLSYMFVFVRNFIHKFIIFVCVVATKKKSRKSRRAQCVHVRSRQWALSREQCQAIIITQSQTTLKMGYFILSMYDYYLNRILHMYGLYGVCTYLYDTTR